MFSLELFRKSVYFNDALQKLYYTLSITLFLGFMILYGDMKKISHRKHFNMGFNKNILIHSMKFSVLKKKCTVNYKHYFGTYF